MSPLALVSVSDKTNLIHFCKNLVDKFGYKILSSGGTAKYLVENNIPVTKVSTYTNSPEILDGRVKTLHPKIHGGILAMRSNEKHLNDLRKNNIGLIDLVVVNLYPFKDKIKQKCSWEEAIENIDIGGPSMIRSAAKNHKDVSVLVSPDQYESFLEKISEGAINSEFKTKLAFEAFQHTANYDAAISNWISSERNLTKTHYQGSYPLIKSLRYGENPHQKAFWYGSDETGWNAAKQLQGKELSYNNLLDLEAALATVLEFGYDKESNSELNTNLAVILKHNNPCGAAIGDSLSNAFKKALECDDISAFGGIIAFNRAVDTDTAHELTKMFLECIVAPSYEKDALKILKNKENLRLLEFKKDMLENKNQKSVKSIMGGLLIQDYDKEVDNEDEWEIVTNKSPNEQEMLDLRFAWNICKHVKSNGIVIVKNQQTLGIGAGQMNRVGAARIALNAAKGKCHGGVLASDGFFPFGDTVELSSEYGINAIIQPGGSLRDNESINICNEKDISMILTRKRHFLH